MKTKTKVIIGGVLIVILAILLKTPLFILATSETVDITVEKTYIKRVNHEDVFFVETKKGETFRNEDCVWVWKWDSKDIDTQFKKDSTYSVSIYGIRNNFFSFYKNVSDIN